MAGTTIKVSKVDALSPEIIDQAMGGHKVLWVRVMGSKPATVVRVVSRMGRVRLPTASAIACSSGPLTDTPAVKSCAANLE